MEPGVDFSKLQIISDEDGLLVLCGSDIKCTTLSVQGSTSIVEIFYESPSNRPFQKPNIELIFL